MNTSNIQNPTHVVLKDGTSQIATWLQHFNTLPTVGDTVDFSNHLAEHKALDGYRPTAKVNRVGTIGAGVENFIELAVECGEPENERPLLVLNSSRIPVRAREAVEEAARELTRHPRIVWEESFDPHSLLRARLMEDTDHRVRKQLKQRIDDILSDSVKLSMR